MPLGPGMVAVKPPLDPPFLLGSLVAALRLYLGAFEHPSVQGGGAGMLLPAFRFWSRDLDQSEDLLGLVGDLLGLGSPTLGT